MKKFIAVCLALILTFSAALTLYVTTRHHFPEGSIYNYFEYSSGGNLIRHLDDYVAAQTTTSIIIYDKKKQESYILGDSVFDTTKQMPFLLHTSENTLYYFCRDRQTKCITYYSFDIDTYEKIKLSSDSAVVNTAGFLGTERILGITLRADKSLSIASNLGRNWINASGIHDAKGRRTFLAAQEGADAYGVYDNLDKIAETDERIFFLNFFGELICFDKDAKAFSTVADCLISDFFITAGKLYYVTDETVSSLYVSDYDGKNAEQIESATPVCVKFSNGRVFIADENNAVYDITTGTAVKIGDSPTASWVADDNGVYSFNHTKQEFTVIEF